MTPETAVITGVGLAVPGLTGAEDLLQLPSGEGGFDPATGLKGREMRHKDRASRLALRAVEPALRDAGLLTDDGAYGGSASATAVVVSTNFGNLDSVCDFADTIAEQTVTGLSPLGLPHTSSNVIAGWIAIRYGMRGPNITVCNGPTSGIDALYWARNLIAVRRAEVVVVIGVEPDTEPVARLLAEGSQRPLLDGAAALVVESAGHARTRAARPRATLSEVARATDPRTAVDEVLKAGAAPVGLWLTAADPSLAAADTALGPDAVPTLDLTARLGHCSGALGVLQCAAGVAHLGRGGFGPVLATSGGAADDDAAAALLLTGIGAAR